MDRPTVEVYERSARAYAEARSAGDPRRPEAFRREVPDGALRLDLGCGPGLHLGLLGRPVVGADAAAAMLAEAIGRAPWALPVRCDLEALPFRRGAVAGIWANKTHQHIAAAHLPMALAELHRVMPVGGRLDLMMFEGDGTFVSGGDLPGRQFTFWPAAELEDLLIGAGFDVASIQLGDPEPSAFSTAPAFRPMTVTGNRARTLADTVGAGMALLCCGLNPSLYAADAGIAFARPGNRFWPALRAAGLTDLDRGPRALLQHDRIGLTDLVKRATARADGLTRAEYRDGVGRVERLCRRLEPRAVCMIGLTGWRSAVDRAAAVGWQPAALGGVPVYVMPSTSGVNAHATPAALAGHLRAAAAGP